jgi:sigma-E factor negative regulatory protein RseA
MKDRISALMDGELDDKSVGELIGNLPRDGEGAEAWRAYHLIGDAMRGTAPLTEGLKAGFASRVAWKLADEPTVLSPGLIRPEPRRWFTVPALAASLAAVALVGWMAFAPQPALVPQPIAQVQPAQQIPEKPVLIPLPTAANDYLLAHQGFSPRMSLQGMLPYVRTVSEQNVEPRK